MVAHHCTFVVHTMSEYDLNFNTLVMKDIVSLSHDMGLEVYINPWGVGRVFGGPEPYSHWIAERPDQCQRMNDGSHAPDRLPGQPALSRLREVLDRPGGRDRGRHRLLGRAPLLLHPRDALRQRRARSVGLRLRPVPGALCRAVRPRHAGRPWMTTLSGSGTRSCLTSSGRSRPMPRSRGMKNAVCVLPDENPLVGPVPGTHLPRYESLDIFGTDPYWMVFDRPLDQYVRDTTRRVMDICGKTGKEAQLWVQAFLIWKGREEEVGAGGPDHGRGRGDQHRRLGVPRVGLLEPQMPGSRKGLGDPRPGLRRGGREHKRLEYRRNIHDKISHRLIGRACTSVRRRRHRPGGQGNGHR